MFNSWSEFYHKKALEKKASKVADRQHLIYSWLRADQALVQLGQLKRSHALTPCVKVEDKGHFSLHLASALREIKIIKIYIKDYEAHLKKQAGKK